MERTITGRIGEIAISETIRYYRPDISEQVQTAQKNICQKFADLGYYPIDIVFD